MRQGHRGLISGAHIDVFRRVIRLCCLLILCCASEVSADPLWVAVGFGGRRISSVDGKTWENDQRWSDEKGDDENVLFDVAYGLDRFIAVGGGAKTGHILSTLNGREWKELPQVKGRVSTIAFGRNRFVAGHDAELLYSGDGEVFSSGERLPWNGSVHARCSACGDTEAGFRFLIIGDIDLSAEKKRVGWRAATADGTVYVHTALDTPAAHGLAYGAGHFVAVGPQGLIESSHDGQTWSRHNVGVSDDFSRVVWTGQRFVVSGGKQVWTSLDGLTWRAEIQPISWTIAWAREPRMPAFPVALGISREGNIHLTSDFASWRKAALPTGPSLEAIAFAGH